MNGSNVERTPRKGKDPISSYARPTESSKFKTIKQSVNRLAKYRPIQEVPGFRKTSNNKTYRLSLDPALLKSFHALSKTSLSNAKAIYQEAKKQDLLLNSSLPTTKKTQTQNKGITEDEGEHGEDLNQQASPHLPKKKIKHSTPTSTTTEEEELDVENSPLEPHNEGKKHL